jgi:hypothetical protein
MRLGPNRSDFGTMAVIAVAALAAAWLLKTGVEFYVSR